MKRKTTKNSKKVKDKKQVDGEAQKTIQERIAYLEIFKNEDGTFWGMLQNMWKENDSRYITKVSKKYKDIFNEGMKRARQLGWYCIEVKETDLSSLDSIITWGNK